MRHEQETETETETGQEKKHAPVAEENVFKLSNSVFSAVFTIDEKLEFVDKNEREPKADVKF
jgi:hypothetical protein